MTAENAPRRDTQIHKQCTRMEELLQGLGESIRSIEERISPVLRTTDSLKTTDETHEELVPHAEVLYEYNERIAEAVARLNDMCARVEL